VTSREQYNRSDWPDLIGPPTGWTTTRAYRVGNPHSWAEIRSFYLARLLIPPTLGSAVAYLPEGACTDHGSDADPVYRSTDSTDGTLSIFAAVPVTSLTSGRYSIDVHVGGAPAACGTIR
jgi:hypothetical protein